MRATRHPQGQGLFSAEQLQRFRTLELEAPTLYGVPAPPDHGGSASTASSAVQAEVQRQLQEFMNQHKTETVNLRQQVEQLRRERNELQAAAEARAHLPGGDRAQHSHLPGGDRAQHSHLPGGDRAQHSQLPGGDRAQHSHLPGGDRAQHSHLPGGDRAQHSHLPGGDRAQHSQLPGGDRAQHSHLPGGDRAQHSHLPGGDRAQHSHLPGGDRAQHSHLPGGDRAQHSHLPGGDRAQHSQLPGGDRAQHSHLPGGDRAQHSQLPGGDRAQHSQLPGGDRAQHSQLPGGDRAQHSQLPGGDRAQHSQLPGGDRAQHSQLPGGDRAQHSQLPGGEPSQWSEFSQRNPVTDPQSHQDEEKQQEGGDESQAPGQMGQVQPTPMELLSVIATGMRQLQEVQLKQMDKKDGPEVVKPGISSLPHLESPGKDTSPVDIQDWLEEVGSIMGDLSDTSHEWWTGVRAVADEHYKKWVTATPMEKLTLALPKDCKLEQGKYGRVNARAAGMILGALPSEVKSEMVTKKVTGSSLSLVFKLLTTYRPGGEQEKTLLLEQLTAPEGAQTPEAAVQALRKWGRWFSRAKDLTVAVPDPVLMVKGLAQIVAPVLIKNHDVWLRTTMMRNRLQLDSNPTEGTTLDFHKHLQAEMELLSTATSTTSRTAPRIKSAAANQESTSASTATAGARAKVEKKEKPCKWFARSDDGCRRGADFQFQHDWGTTAKTGRCLVCSAVGHQKKDCPTRKRAEGAQQSPTSSTKGKGKGDKGNQSASQSSSSTAPPATRSMTAASGPKDTPQPGPEPSPAGSPTSTSKEPPGDLQQILSDAHQMLKTMMATTSPTSSTTTSGAPTYESIQRQLDEMKLKALKVKIPPQDDEDARGALLDSGATHVLRPAKDEQEHRTSKEVPVVLAGDEKRLLRQNPAGSIILNPSMGEDVQTILPLGKLVDSLGCTLKWTRGSLMLKHPRYGTIRTKIRAGCPEIADSVQAAALIAELEERRINELRQRTEDLQDRLNAIRMMEVTKGDWRQDLAAYAQEGCVVDGLQAIYKSPIFKNLPEDVLMGMVPNVEANDAKGWEYLKSLPVSRRIRKKLLRSKAWVVNLYGGKDLKHDPVQSLKRTGERRHEHRGRCGQC